MILISLFVGVAVTAAALFVAVLVAPADRPALTVSADRESPVKRREWVGQQLEGAHGFGLTQAIKADLFLVGKTPERYRYERLVGLVGFTVVGLGGGWVAGSRSLVVVGIGVGLVVGWVLPRQLLASEANEKRNELLGQLSFWAELIAAAVGGSQAVGFAAKKTAERGDGWVWDMFRTACDRADTTNENLPFHLRQLAEKSGLPELTAFAQAVESGQEQGGVVQSAVANQAGDLRRKVHGEQKRAGASRNTAMVVPVSLLFVAFMAFLFFLVVQSLTIAF